MLRAIRQPKERDDIVITKLDKGSDVVVMDKTDYVHFFGYWKFVGALVSLWDP